MTGLNYRHLYYFWIVAREGGISHASDALDISPSTISAQISRLEATHGVRLFDRVGRNLRLSEVGQIAFRYAEEIGVADMDTFKADFKSKKYADKMKANLAMGKKYGVRSTPTFYINGKMQRGAMRVDQLKKLIEEEKTFVQGLIDEGMDILERCLDELV